MSYSQLIEWFNMENASSLSPSLFEIPFGKLSSSHAFDTKVRKLNYALLFAKYHIYCQKLNDKALKFITPNYAASIDTRKKV